MSEDIFYEFVKVEDDIFQVFFVIFMEKEDEEDFVDELLSFFCFIVVVDKVNE